VTVTAPPHPAPVATVGGEASGWLARAGVGPAVLLGVALFITYGYFVPPAAWNENSRFNLTRSLIERRRVDIDPFHANTGDKSFRDGHYYCDKAPGASFLGAIPYALYYGYLKATGRPLPNFTVRVTKGAPGSTPLTVSTMGAASSPSSRATAAEDEDRILINISFRKALYVCNLFTNALAGALGGVLFYILLCGLGLPGQQAFVTTLAFALGSLFFPYATMFYGHVLAATFLFASFALVYRSKQSGLETTPRVLTWAGVLAAAAVVAEFPTGVAAIAIAVYALSALRDRARIVFFAAGAVAPAVLLFLYQGAAFGSPLRPGYALVSGAEFAQGMSKGLMGITYPKLGVLYEILFGRFRGLFYISPVLILGFIGLARLCRRPGPLRAEAILAAVIVAYFVLMNSAYFMWSGGAALGPRHVIPMLPFLCLGIPFAVRKRRWIPVALIAVSIFNQTIATAVAPEAPPEGDPLFDHAYFHFFHGRVAVLPGTTNLGLLIGMPGPLSVLPLAVIWFLTVRALLPALRTVAGGNDPAAAIAPAVRSA